MAFPQVLQVSQGDLATATTHNIAYASPGAGDLGVLIIQEDDDDALTIGAFTFIGEATNASGKLAVYARRMTGSEGTGTFSVGIAATEEICYHLYYIDAGTWRDSGTLTNDVEAAGTTATNASISPPSLNPAAWGTEDTLWIAACGSSGSAAFNSAASNYTDLLQNSEGGTCQLSSCRRELNAASDDPDGMGQSQNGGTHYAVTVAIRPNPNVVVTMGAASLSLTAFAPTVTVASDVIAEMGKAELALTSFAPTVSTPRLVTPAKASLVITPFAPTVSTPVVATPAKVSLALTTFAPTVINPQSATLGKAELALTTFAPTVTAALIVTPQTAVLALATFAPAVLTPVLVVPATAELETATFAPTITVGQRATPSPASLTLTPFAPSVLTPVVVTPAPGSLVLSLKQLVVTLGTVVTPGTASLSLTGHAPTVLTPVVVTPGPAGLVLVTFPLEVSWTMPVPIRPIPHAGRGLFERLGPGRGAMAVMAPGRASAGLIVFSAEPGYWELGDWESGWWEFGPASMAPAAGQGSGRFERPRPGRGRFSG